MFCRVVLATIGFAGTVTAQTLVLDDFNAGTVAGRVVAGSTWDGNVTQNTDSITVGGSALDENGWQAPVTHIDATGMNYVTITARRDSGNQAPSFAIQFEDPNLNTTVFSVATSLFAIGEFTVVHIPITGWSASFDFTEITAWNLGGGSPGTVAFRLTIDELLLESSILAAPQITSQAESQTVTTGATVSFTVTTSNIGSFTYQWFKDGTTPLPSNASANTATLVLPAVSVADSGVYTCTVTNTSGSATSPAFTLTVRPVAVVVLSDLTPTYSGTARTATVSTTPTGLSVTVTYDGSATPPVNAGTYAVVATVVDDSYVGSASGSMVVAKRTPVITWDAGGPLNDGDALTASNLSATADTAGSFVYDPPLGTILAAGEHTLTALFTPTDTANELPISTTRLLAVSQVPPTVQTPPADQTTLVGQTVSFSVSAIGPGTLRYEWSRGADVLPGAISRTLELSNVTLADAGDYSVRVYNAAGSAPVQSAQLTVFDVAASHASAGAGYVAGGSVTVSNTLTYAGSLTLSQVRWSVLPPAAVSDVKWSFVSSSGDDGATRPSADHVDLFEWQWAAVPASPLSFTYTMTVPAAATGSYDVTGMIHLTVNGVALDAIVKPDPLSLSPAAQQHSADTDEDFAIGLSELLRVIELYNTRFGSVRTGRYQLQTGTVDGFSSDPSVAADAPTSLTTYHSADFNRDGLIALNELLRVIELYNHREGTTRTGRYYVSPGTTDGFAPGSG